MGDRGVNATMFQLLSPREMTPHTPMAYRATESARRS